MASNIPVIVQGNSFSLAIPLQIYYINGDQMDLEDYTPDPTDEVTIQLKGSRRNYTYTPTIDGNVANIDLSGNELADNYSVVVSIVKANGQRLRSFRTDQFFIVESSDDLTPADIIEGLEENVIYLNSSIFVAGEDGRGIVSIAKTSTSGLVDTYTITYTDNTTSTFNVTNGAQGAQGAQGVGITSIEKTSTSGLVDTYTITLSNGNTSTFEVTNGRDGVDLGLVEIADNLTTDDATQVLSAKQGYVLKDLIDSQLITVPNVDLEIGDEEGYVLARFSNGEIETKNFNSANTPKSDTTPEIDVAEEGDFELSDDEGNVLMRLENGHIKVKNFNSEEIEISNPMLDKFKGLKLGIIGDSISTYNGWLPSSISGYDGSNYVTYYPSGDVNAVSKTWWYKAAEMLGLNPSTDINNCAWSGCQLSGDSTSTSSAKVGCSTRRVTDLAARGFTPDIILVFISCNDWRNNVAVGTWAVTDAVPAEGNITTMRAAYALLLNKIHTTYPSARVFCCTNLDDPRRDATQGYPSNNGNGVTTSQWNDNIVEIAEAFGCDVINMHNCGLTYQNMASFATDGGTHPNAAGMAMMARKAASELIAKY